MAIWHDWDAGKLPDWPPPNTLTQHLGIELTEMGADYLRGRMKVDSRTVQMHGSLHGGASVSMAESLMSFGAYCTVDRSRFYCVGLEINANHMRGVREGYVTATARPLHRGKTTQVWQCEIRDERDALVCVCRMTAAVIAR